MNQKVETFLRTYIDFDQRNWAKLLFITEFVINNKNAVSTKVFFFSRISPQSFGNRRKPDAKHGNPIQKTNGIINKLKKTNNWVQTTMAIAQQKLQNCTNRTKTQTLKYKIKNKV